MGLLTNIQNIIVVFVAINIFIAGINYEQSKNDTLPVKVLSLLLALLVGSLIQLVVLIIDLSLVIWEWITVNTQIKFFVLFYFTKKFNNLKEEDLERVSNSVLLNEESGWKNKILKYSVRLVNDRNNYTFTPKEINK